MEFSSQGSLVPRKKRDGSKPAILAAVILAAALIPAIFAGLLPINHFIELGGLDNIQEFDCKGPLVVLLFLIPSTLAIIIGLALDVYAIFIRGTILRVVMLTIGVILLAVLCLRVPPLAAEFSKNARDGSPCVAQDGKK